MRSSKWLVFIRSPLAGFDRSLTELASIRDAVDEMKMDISGFTHEDKKYPGLLEEMKDTLSSIDTTMDSIDSSLNSIEGNTSV